MSMERFYYGDSISNFLVKDQDAILGQLTRIHEFDGDISQRNAWIFQIKNLKQQLQSIQRGHIFFEFSIPRMGKRADNILFVDNVIFVVEYKVGSDKHDNHAKEQALDYALDLKDFHEGSHDRYIVPILVATSAESYDNKIAWYDDKVAAPLLCNDSDLLSTIHLVLQDCQDNVSENDAISWATSGYKPTPTIIQAAQALYQEHAVEDISRSDAGVQNLTATSNSIFKIIEHSKSNNRKSICFVTGVPGAGKTLAGLNVATQKPEGLDENAVFLSGNGPLVIVLQEALARDDVERKKINGMKINKKDALRETKAFIQNIHHFRDEGLKSKDAPNEHVVIFDEAQRAWNQEHAEKFMKQKKGFDDFNMSEPEFLISLMDRRQDWSVIICLIGGGQEINTGEAGLLEWFNALENKFQHWDIYHSGQLADKNYNWGENLRAKLSSLNAEEKTDLHLSVSIRSFRAEKLAEFIEAIIDGDSIAAAEANTKLEQYPMVITRDIDKAHAWLKERARGSERFGKVASSGGIRLKPEGIYVKSGIQPEHWFLSGKEDVRSSYYLEDVATEFDVQGLELDWTCVCWEGDFRMENKEWKYYNFKGTKWQNVNDDSKKIYLANAYRVLLTRARQGMVIFIPHGDDRDYTRLPIFYDGTYEFLKSCGIREI